MAKIIIDEYDDTTPYGIAPNDTTSIFDHKITWCDKQDLTDLRNQIDNILNRGE